MSTGSAEGGGGRKGGNRLLVLLHGEKAGEPLVRDAIKRLRADGHQVRHACIMGHDWNMNINMNMNMNGS